MAKVPEPPASSPNELTVAGAAGTDVRRDVEGKGQAWEEDAGDEQLYSFVDAVGFPRFVFQLPVSSYGATMVIPLLVEQSTWGDWMRYSGMTYLRLAINYFMQGNLVLVLHKLHVWNATAIKDANEAGDGCFKLIGVLYVVCIWLHCSAVLMDMKETLKMAEVLCNMIPTVEGRSQLLRFAKGDDGPILRGGGMSMLRKAGLVLGVILPKLTIAVCTLLFGGMYLGVSEGNPDLILNSLAIVFIMDIDEMVSAFLAPGRISRLVENLPPFESDEMSLGWNFGQSYSTALNLAISAAVIGILKGVQEDAGEVCTIDWAGRWDWNPWCTYPDCIN